MTPGPSALEQEGVWVPPWSKNCTADAGVIHAVSAAEIGPVQSPPIPTRKLDWSAGPLEGHQTAAALP